MLVLVAGTCRVETRVLHFESCFVGYHTSLGCDLFLGFQDPIPQVFAMKEMNRFWRDLSLRRDARHAPPLRRGRSTNPFCKRNGGWMAAQFRPIANPDDRAVTPDVIKPVASVLFLCPNDITTSLMNLAQTAIPTDPLTWGRVLLRNLVRILNLVRVINRLAGGDHGGLDHHRRTESGRGDCGFGVHGGGGGLRFCYGHSGSRSGIARGLPDLGWRF